jgi:hypothetical protein
MGARTTIVLRNIPMNLTQIIILTAAFILPFPILAGPPDGMKPEMIPIRTQCLAASEDPNHFTTVVGALTRDFGVHVSMTFSASPEQKVAIVENPDTTLAGVLLITPHATCLAFSGRDAVHFDRPPDMKPPEIDVHNPAVEKDVES